MSSGGSIDFHWIANRMSFFFFLESCPNLSFAVLLPPPESSTSPHLRVSLVSPDSSLAGGDDNSVLQKLLILDARSYTAAVANRAKGGGCECEGQGNHTLETVLCNLLPACFYNMMQILAIVFSEVLHNCTRLQQLR